MTGECVIGESVILESATVESVMGECAAREIVIGKVPRAMCLGKIP